MIDIFDAREYIEAFLRIRDKSGQVVPLRLNAAQRKLHAALEEQDRAGKPMRAIVLKARQLGFSTYTEARLFHLAATREHRQTMVLAHRDDSTDQLFAMCKRFYEHLPAPLRPMLARDNDGQILFDNPSRRRADREKRPGLGSSLICATAGTGQGVGRGMTLQAVHCSEFAFWRGNKQETLLGILQAVPSEQGTLVVIESTANGFEEFQQLWAAAEAGQNDFVPIFCGWQEEPDYRKPVPPGTVWTQKELALREALSLDEEQLAWRRWCIQNNCGGDEKKFRQEYPSTPEEAFLTSGTGVFDNEIVMSRLRSAPDPVRRGRFACDYDGLQISDIRWEDDEERGEILIYEEPREGWPYVLGGDTAGEGSDRFVGHVLNNVTGAQAAVIVRTEDEIWWTRQMYCLGMWYGEALMGVECNFSTFPQRELERLGYARFYMRERYDTATHAVGNAYGFATTAKTRPAIIGELVKIMRESPELVADKETLREMLTFIRNDAGRPEAAEGEHDDRVMALAIAHAIRGQQSSEAPREELPTAKWTPDKWEDFRRASQEEREELLRKWGRPI